MTIINPYLVEINTDIVSNRSIDKNIEIKLAKSIALDYKQYNIHPEDIYIDGNLVKAIKDRKTFILDGPIEKKTLSLSTDLKRRQAILRDISSRYLISNILKKYLNLQVKEFNTYKDYSSFFIENIYFDNQALDIIEILEEIIKVYIDLAIDISSKIEANQSIIDGIYDGPFLGPHLSNTSEIKNFKVQSFTFNEKGLTVNYLTY